MDSFFMNGWRTKVQLGVGIVCRSSSIPLHLTIPPFPCDRFRTYSLDVHQNFSGRALVILFDVGVDGILRNILEKQAQHRSQFLRKDGFREVIKHTGAN
jgi:hypothetical protein